MIRGKESGREDEVGETQVDDMILIRQLKGVEAMRDYDMTEDVQRDNTLDAVEDLDLGSKGGFPKVYQLTGYSVNNKYIYIYIHIFYIATSLCRSLCGVPPIQYYSNYYADQ